MALKNFADLTEREILAIAIASVLVSNKSQTPAVLSAAGGALSGSLSSAQGN